MRKIAFAALTAFILSMGASSAFAAGLLDDLVHNHLPSPAYDYDSGNG
jgi:hypothetical protein